MGTDTSYLGLRLPHPFIAGASPFGRRLDTVRRLEEAGCAAVVLHSLFEEQITLAAEGRIHHMDAYGPDFAATLRHFPAPAEYAFSPDGYAEHVRRVKEAIAIPVLASLNGTSTESWMKFSQLLEQAGADALELNVYEVETDLSASGAAVEERIEHFVRELKRLVKIPVAVKLSPFFTAFGNVARRLNAAGADGLVLFNRFYQSDIDISTMEAVPQVELSTSAELLLRLRWVAILHGRVRSSLAVSGGVATPEDGIKAILAGADAVQIVSGLLRHGPAYVRVMLDGLERWMALHDIERLDEVRGRVSLKRTADPLAFERASYIHTLQSVNIDDISKSP